MREYYRPMADLRICIDVPDLDRAIAFYSAALGLRPGRRNGALWMEMLGAVHLGLAVPDLEIAVEGARTAGATLERPIVERKWGRMANMADPFGHGFCLLQFTGRGYEEIATWPST